MEINQRCDCVRIHVILNNIKHYQWYPIWLRAPWQLFLGKPDATCPAEPPCTPECVVLARSCIKQCSATLDVGVWVVCCPTHHQQPVLRLQVDGGHKHAGEGQPGVVRQRCMAAGQFGVHFIAIDSQKATTLGATTAHDAMVPEMQARCGDSRER